MAFSTVVLGLFAIFRAHPQRVSLLCNTIQCSVGSIFVASTVAAQLPRNTVSMTGQIVIIRLSRQLGMRQSEPPFFF